MKGEKCRRYRFGTGEESTAETIGHQKKRKRPHQKCAYDRETTSKRERKKQRRGKGVGKDKYLLPILRGRGGGLAWEGDEKKRMTKEARLLALSIKLTIEKSLQDQGGSGKIVWGPKG